MRLYFCKDRIRRFANVINCFKQKLDQRLVFPINDGSLRNVGDGGDAEWQGAKKNLRASDDNPFLFNADARRRPAEGAFEFCPCRCLQDVTLRMRGDKRIPFGCGDGGGHEGGL